MVSLVLRVVPEVHRVVGWRRVPVGVIRRAAGNIHGMVGQADGAVRGVDRVAGSVRCPVRFGCGPVSYADGVVPMTHGPVVSIRAPADMARAPVSGGDGMVNVVCKGLRIEVGIVIGRAGVVVIKSWCDCRIEPVAQWSGESPETSGHRPDPTNRSNQNQRQSRG